MYNIIQLNDKNLSELQTIAQELGIKKTDSLKKEETCLQDTWRTSYRRRYQESCRRQAEGRA